eukprot:9077854-Pyramimonas_sp.AAC.1
MLAGALALLPTPAHKPRVRPRIVSSVLEMACTRWFRCSLRCSSVPLKLWTLVDKSATVPETRRVELARNMLQMTDRDMQLQWDNSSAKKIRILCRSELRSMAEDGLRDTTLYTCALICRAALPGDTQDIEGLNSQLQWIVNLARAMEQPSTDARRCIRNGRLADADWLAQLHVRTLHFMDTDTHLMRYAPVP